MQELVSLCEDPNLQELDRYVTRNPKVSTPAHTKHPGQYVDLGSRETRRYPELESAMIDTARKHIANLTTPLIDFVRNLVRREMAYINIENDEFASSALVIGAFEVDPEAQAKGRKAAATGAHPKRIVL